MGSIGSPAPRRTGRQTVGRNILDTELESLHCKSQNRPLVREGAPHQQTLNYLKIIEDRKGTFGRGSQMGACHQDGLADCHFDFDFDFLFRYVGG
jgi:hypothetical protein